MIVVYSCSLCGLKNAPVEVPEPGADRIGWFCDKATPRVFANHSVLAPNCQGYVDLRSVALSPVTVEDLKR